MVRMGSTDMITKIGKRIAEKDGSPTFKEVALTVGKGSGLTGIAGTLAGLGALYGATKDKAMELNTGDFEKLKDSMKSSAIHAPAGTRSKFLDTATSHYNPMTNTVNPGHTLATAAHEIGHSTGMNLLTKKPFLALRKVGLPANVMAARAGIIERNAKGRKLSRSEKNEILAADVLQYASAPTLLEEMRASTRGLRHLAKTHGVGKALKSSPYLLGALGSYAAQSAAPFVIRRLARNGNMRSDD